MAHRAHVSLYEISELGKNIAARGWLREEYECRPNTAPWSEEKKSEFVEAWARGDRPKDLAVRFGLLGDYAAFQVAKRLGVIDYGAVVRKTRLEIAASKRHAKALETKAELESVAAEHRALATERRVRARQRDERRAALRQKKEEQKLAWAQEKLRREKLRHVLEMAVQRRDAEKEKKRAIGLFNYTFNKSREKWTDRQKTIFRELVSQGTSLQECATLLKKKVSDLEKMSRKMGLEWQTNDSIGALRRD